MKIRTFALRCGKEILRDPLTAGFGLGFPTVLLLMLTAIQRNIPVALFSLPELTPGIAVFGLAFLSLFSAQLMARDRGSALFLRVLSSPMTVGQLFLGYLLPLFPMAVAQSAICLGVAALLGLPVSLRWLTLLGALLPADLLFIALGLLCGSVLNEKQVGGICGALLTNLTAWLSGTWFSLELVGEGFRNVANLLPFVHAVEAGRAALAGKSMGTHLWWVLGYAVILWLAAMLCFRRSARKN